MDHLALVPGLQVPEHRGIVEEGQVDHVLALFKLRRVHPADLFLQVGHLESFKVIILSVNTDNLFMAHSDGEFSGKVRVFSADRGNFCSIQQKTLAITSGFGVRNPN